MEKMKFETVDGTRRNVDKIAEMFPQVVTEVLGEDGKLKRAVKWDVLKELLSGDYVEGGECYEFSWPGKRAAIAEAAKPIRKTLRPCKEESKNWDTTENLYIEGDNLEVLKLLQESYLGKVKMIYIDPPYNTGNDFVYKDNFTKTKDTSEDELGLFDEETDNRTMSGELFLNTESNGRFHSDWLNMIYPRLKVAKDFLSVDGVIFISIGQDEGYNLIKCCNEIFGATNRVGIISRMMKSGGNKGQYFSPNIEYVLVYAYDINQLEYFREPISDELIDKVYNLVETDGTRKGQKFRIMGLYQAGLDIRPNQRYWIKCPDGSYAIPAGTTFPSTLGDATKVLPVDGDGVWRWSADRYIAELKNCNIYFKKTNTSSLLDENGKQSKWNIYTKIWLDDRLEEGRVPVDLITKWENRISSQELKELNLPFDFAKPVDLIRYLIGLVANTKNANILDFFSGSATTAHAVMKLNAEDGGKRKFIMVQLPEVCEEKSEAAKAGYKNICEIGKERIRRAGEKILAECAARTNGSGNGDGSGECGGIPDLDIGFRVFKVADSNMKDVYYSASDYSQDMLDSLISNIKEDRTDLDLLYGCLLEWGVELSLPHTSETIDNVTIHTVNNGDLIACFDADITESAIRTIAKRQPLRVVFRDSSFASAPQKINVEEIFKLLSPTTTVKVI